tara:strand:- start:22 stop:255 length:234 start_codon:yes stop_codon:yes gene_type:complete
MHKYRVYFERYSHQRYYTDKLDSDGFSIKKSDTRKGHKTVKADSSCEAIAIVREYVLDKWMGWGINSGMWAEDMGSA